MQTSLRGLRDKAPATKHESMRCCETRWKAPAPQPPHGQPTLPNVCNPGQSRPRKRPAMRVSARGAASLRAESPAPNGSHERGPEPVLSRRHARAAARTGPTPRFTVAGILVAVADRRLLLA